jgi:SAM-dependent methyltransferase
MLRAVDETHLRRATSFGSVAEDYARARPGYPREAVRWALEHAPGAEVLDLAAGTGKLTAAILDAGAGVVAVEPLDGMRAQLQLAFPDVRVLAGSAENIPLADDSVDAVMVGQAFHWFDAAAALDEIARVLRPGGVLAPMWNVRDDSVDWIVAMTEAGAGGGDMLSMMGGADWALLDGDSRFTRPERRDFPNPERFDTERLLALARSTSALATMEPGAREGVLERLAAMTREHPQLRGRETFNMPLVTVAVRSALG